MSRKRHRVIPGKDKHVLTLSAKELGQLRSIIGYIDSNKLDGLYDSLTPLELPRYKVTLNSAPYPTITLKKETYL